MEKHSPRTKQGLGREPIAIVGMSCRFPKVSSLENFWELLFQGKDTIDEIKRWDIDRYYDEDKTAKNKTHQRHSSLFENIDDFDPFFFNISPAEASEMTPSQKLILELAWETIENSTIPYQEIQGKKAGVYIGNIWNDFEHLRKHKNAEITLHSAVGQSSNVIANRVSYFMGFTGPSLVVDTGCSTSLVALHLACQGLWDGSISHALAGGVNHILDPDQNLLLSKFGGLSASGKCSTFDESVDGFVRGEGAGLLLLRRLSEAEAAGDHIYAVIKGSAMNNNGYNVNLPATSTTGQMDVLREAYKDSGILPEDVHYVETHGTGTKLGDPTECRAIGQFFSQNREIPLSIGSVKTNLGHTEATAGIAGLIKTVLAINHKVIPRNLNFKTPNPEIDFEGLKLKVQQENTLWPVTGNESLKAGINSFGWGGTNAHVVIEEYRPSFEIESRVIHQKSHFVLPVSAKSEDGLTAYVSKFRDQLTKMGANDFVKNLASAAIRKPKLSHGELFVGKDQTELLIQMEKYLETPTPEETELDSLKVAFVFPGQGSQWLGMGQELYKEEPVFKQAIDDCEKAFEPYTNWSLVEQLYASEEDSRLNEINVIQPMLFAMQISLARLWIAFGIKPRAVVGHSMGEVASAFISGALSLDNAAQVICTRSRLMQTVSGQGGAMAVTELTLSEAETLISSYHGLSVAVNNSPKSTVIAGNQKEITRLLEELEDKGLFGRQVNVDVASHSEQMDPIKDELYNTLSSIRPTDTLIDLYSTVKASQVDGETLTVKYWADNLREGVQFASTMEQMIERGYNLFIEVSPHPVLVTSIQECLEAFESKGVVSPTLLRNKPETQVLYGYLNDMFKKGLHIDWSSFYDHPNLSYYSLPSYPFQRSTYSVSEGRSLQSQFKGGHALIGEELQLQLEPGVYFWKTSVAIEDFPFLTENELNGMTQLPIAFYIEMALEAISHVAGSMKVMIRNLELIRPVFTENNASLDFQIKLSDSSRAFEILVLSKGKWDTCLNGSFETFFPLRSQPEKVSITTPETSIDVADFYHLMKDVGFNLKADTGMLDSIHVDGKNAVASFKMPDKQSVAGDFLVSPSLLEKCIQTIYSNHLDQWSKEALVPHVAGIEEIQLLDRIDQSEVISVHSFTREIEDGSLIYDLSILNSTGEVCLQFKGIRVSLGEKSEELPGSYLVDWQPSKISESRQNYENVLILYEEDNDLSDQLNIQLDAFDLNVTTIQFKNHLRWSQDLSWNSIDHLVYYANARSSNEKIVTSSIDLISRIARAIEREKPPHLSKITLVTNAAVPYKNLHINLSQAPIAGLTKVLANEYPDFNVSQIDTAILPSPRQTKLLASLIARKTDYEIQTVLRDDQTYVARLKKAVSLSYKKAGFSSSGFHVMIGADEYAIPVIDWMLENGVKKLDLLCEPMAINRLKHKFSTEEINAVIRFHEYSRKEHSSISKVLADHPGRMEIETLTYFDKPARETLFKDFTTDSFSRQLKVKINESLQIHDLVEKLKIPNLLMFTEEASLIGSKGKSAMASSGSFYEGFAALRGQKGQSICLFNIPSSSGSISHVEPLSSDDGKHVLDLGYLNKSNGLGLFKLHIDHAGESIPMIQESQFAVEVLKSPSEKSTGNTVLEDFHQATDTNDKLEILTLFLQQQISEIIKSPVATIATKTKFKYLGVDSLMAVQFRNRIEKGLSLKLSVSDIWKYSNVDELSQYLFETLASAEVSTKEDEISPVYFFDNHSEENIAQLICFHDAGGSASLYEDWAELLGDGIGIIRVELPGRGGEAISPDQTPHIATIIQLISDKLEEKITRPTLFIGHSMGGLFAFEVIHELNNRGFDIPKKLFISSTPQLNSYDRSAFDSSMSEEQLIERFPYLSHVYTPDPELRTFLRSILRMDLRLLDTFEYAKKPGLNLDITCVRGLQDHTVSKKQMMGWESEILGTLELIEREGDHHYIKNDGPFITDLILSELNAFEKVLVPRNSKKS